MKVKGFNPKEQKCFDILKDGEPHTIAELSKKFGAIAKKHCEEHYEAGSYDDAHVSSQAQSFVRNSIRRLIRDGWAEKSAYGTYRLTRNGKKWVAEGKEETTSFGAKRGRKKASTKKVSSKKASTKKVSSKKASTKKAASKKASTKKAASKKAANSTAKGKSIARAKAAKKRAGKAVALERAAAASKRAAEATA